MAVDQGMRRMEVEINAKEVYEILKNTRQKNYTTTKCSWRFTKSFEDLEKLLLYILEEKPINVHTDKRATASRSGRCFTFWILFH
ncbi:hypothetical protein AHAS_Ahas02G0213700 [Arachis hypogaea]